MKIVLGLVTLLASLELCIAFAFQTRYANPQSSRISTRLEASKSKPWASIAAAGLLTISLWGADASLANAGGSRVVGEISGSGLVFKDKLIVESFDDPKIQGVTLYLTSFERPLTERLSKDFFSDPSASSLTCSKSQDKVLVSDNVVATKEGEEVFEESKSLLFKQLRVRRLYDKERNTVVYVTYNTRLNKDDDANKSRFKTSICSVSLLDSDGVAPKEAAQP